ncbi:fibronectin type III domain-containing protein [Galbibacter mesophilus]|uniref:fibronectin type III domain-containing protein n=1 Tax=Galbibacter mesophilus TaxID=379069 RepID=UPI00191CFF4A|nr:fibronectin type III domain-containing protein [Galbibacter mesophilus]MCM5664138.1 fibronectin type III domain-containing protein [Galbibacter mesophilus]
MSLNYFKPTLIAISFAVFASCSGDDTSEMAEVAPGQVENLVATPGNQSVHLEWNNPSDSDLAKIIIRYDGKTREVNKDQNSYEVTELTNKSEYSFLVTAADEAGMVSEVVSVAATPDEYVSAYEATEVVSGTYLTDGENQIKFQITIDGENYKRKFVSGSGFQFIWEGTLKANADGSYTKDVEYYGVDEYGNKDHVAYLLQQNVNAYSFEFNGETMFSEVAFEKIDGDENFLAGTYRIKSSTVSSDKESYNSEYERIATVTENGEYTITQDEEIISEGVWSNDDLLKNKVIFVKLKNRTFLHYTIEDLAILQ